MTQTMKTYEGMFLLDAGNPDFQAASEPARTALDRNEAQILSIKPWEERRLAYEIRGRKRGLYILAYFKAPPERITEIERHCQLDERVLRLLILRRDDLTEETILAETPATAGARRAAARKAEDPAVGARAADAEETVGLADEDAEVGLDEEVPAVEEEAEAGDAEDDEEAS